MRRIAGSALGLALFVLVLVPVPAAAEPAPSLQAGDFWLYEVTKAGVPTKGQINVSVTIAEASGYTFKVLRVPSSGPKEFDWSVLPDLSVREERWAGGTKRYEPPLRELAFPIGVDALSEQKVSVTVTPTTGNSSVIEFEHRTRVVRRETVSTGAGNFDTYVAERTDIGSIAKYTIWYAPAAGAAVKRDYWEGDVLRESWSLVRFSFGAAPPAGPDFAGLGPVGAGIAVGAMALFFLGLVFLRQHGRLGARPTAAASYEIKDEERIVRPAPKAGYEIATLTTSEKRLRVLGGSLLVAVISPVLLVFWRSLGGAVLGFLVGLAMVGLLLVANGIRGEETRKSRPRTISSASGEEPAFAARKEATSAGSEADPGARGGSVKSPQRPTAAKPRARPPERRRTPEELEEEYETKVVAFRARFKNADASRPAAKQAKLLLSKAELAARQGRHDEAVDLLDTAEERLGSE
jgi:hypothetical protein